MHCHLQHIRGSRQDFGRKTVQNPAAPVGRIFLIHPAPVGSCLATSQLSKLLARTDQRSTINSGQLLSSVVCLLVLWNPLHRHLEQTEAWTELGRAAAMFRDVNGMDTPLHAP